MYAMDGVLNSGGGMLRKGRGRRSLLHVPALVPGFYVADLRISLPVEKGWLARQARTVAFGSEEERQRVGDRLALLSGRPAFAGAFVASIQNPLTAALRERKRTDREAFDSLDELVPEVGVLMDSRLNPSDVQVVVLSTAPLDAAQTEWWVTRWDSCRERAGAVGITLQALDFTSRADAIARFRVARAVPAPVSSLARRAEAQRASWSRVASQRGRDL